MNKKRRFFFHLFLAFGFLFIASCTDKELPDTQLPEVPEIPVPPEKNSDYLYDIEALPLIRIDVTPESWNNLLSWYDINPQNEECVPADMTFIKNGQQDRLTQIGLRLRGNTSRRRPEGNYGQLHNPQNPDWHHCHFALKFAEYVDDQKLFGIDRLNLKWHKDDAAYCREIYSYDLFRRFNVWSAPRASYCRLEISVKGDSKVAYYGVYAMIEPVHSDYLSYRKEKGYLKSDVSNLWKAAYGADFVDMSDPKIGVEKITLDPGAMKTFVYDLKTNKKSGFDMAKSQLKDFAQQLKNKSGTDLKNWLESNMDIDLFLRAYAVNVAVGMWDDYWVNANNFYFYFDSDGRLIFIPYDYDNVLGTSLIVNNSGTQSPYYWGSMDNRPLISKIFSISEYKARYKAYLQELADPAKDLFTSDKSKARIQQWQRMISPYVQNDTGEDMRIDDKPAGWGNCHFYRLLTGNDKGGASGDANFFATKCATINKMQ